MTEERENNWLEKVVSLVYWPEETVTESAEFKARRLKELEESGLDAENIWAQRLDPDSEGDIQIQKGAEALGYYLISDEAKVLQARLRLTRKRIIFGCWSEDLWRQEVCFINGMGIFQSTELKPESIEDIKAKLGEYFQFRSNRQSMDEIIGLAVRWHEPRVRVADEWLAAVMALGDKKVLPTQVVPFLHNCAEQLGQ